jgi:energy-coupling factor transport system ATP-binding protein
MELKSPEMLLNMEECRKYLKDAGVNLKPGDGNNRRPVAQATPLLEVKDLRFAYGGIKVLQDVSFRVMPGDVIAVLGHNGCGKTTLLKNVIGLLKPPEKGMVLLGGKDVVDMAVDQAAKMAGFLFQNPDNMLFADTALDEVMFGPTNLGFADAKERSVRAMEEVGLAHKAAEYPRYLGNGEKLRLCVASILAMGPKLIILDEPTTGLDDNECAKLMEVVLKLKSGGVAILIVTHDMNLVAKYADRAIVISNGKIFRDGTPAEILKDSAAMEAASLKSPPIVVLSSGCGRVCLTVEEFMEVRS